MKLTQINSNIGFCGEGKTRVPGEKPLGAEKRTNKLNPHMTPSPGIKTTTPPLLIPLACKHHPFSLVCERLLPAPPPSPLILNQCLFVFQFQFASTVSYSAAAKNGVELVANCADEDSSQEVC